MSAGPETSSVFCDHNAGCPATAEVIAKFIEVEQACPGNPASEHAPGRRARAALEGARERIAAAFEIDAADVVFTSGGTEAANLAVLGLGDAKLPVCLSAVEHPAAFEPAQLRGISLWRVRKDATAEVVAPDLPVGLICLAHAQGEVGSLQPVDFAAAVASACKVPMFVDASQTLGRVPVKPLVAASAIVALSPHKAGGLRGHGVLLGRDLHARLRPLLLGGSQELGRRPGTQSPALAAANALAIERALIEQPTRAERMAAARWAFLDGLQGLVAHELLTPVANSLPNTLMLWFPDVEGRNLMPALDLGGVHASHGSACSSGAPTPPRILQAIGFDAEAARACIRFSFGWQQAPEVLHDAGRRVASIVSRLRKKNRS